MRTYSLTHLSDHALLRDLTAAISQERTSTALVVAHVAEVDARQLYLPAAYPSMFAYCVGELRLSEDAAAKRIQAARAARRFPAIFDALAAGRLNLTGVGVLAPHLTEETADELLAAATHKSKDEIKQLVAERFPQPQVPTRMQAFIPTVSNLQHAPAHVHVDEHAPGHVGAPVQVTPVVAQAFAVHFNMRQRMFEKLQYAQRLLSHELPAQDVPEVLERALDALIQQLEKRKFAATNQPRPGRHRKSGGRYIPAEVKRAVWDRDQAQCTFVSESGHRCQARELLEFDHSIEVARGGEATVGSIRLRCRAHNQYGAERTFGREFMQHKRDEATERDVISGLRDLGIRADEARRAAAHAMSLPDAMFEQRFRAALSYLYPRTARQPAA